MREHIAIVALSFSLTLSASESSLGGTIVALVPSPAEVVAPATPGAVAPAASTNFGNDIRKDYELAKELVTKGAWKVLLQRYNVGLYADHVVAAHME